MSMAFEPKIAQKSPYVLNEEAGQKRAWCACGLSASQPFCDGSHRKHETGLSPIVVELEKTRAIAWCGCKRSAKAPYCDGTHNRL